MTHARRFDLVPFGSDARDGSLACDGLVGGNTIHLSHWSGNRTPREWMADTSVEIALGYAERHGSDGREGVVNNHFDTDGVLAVYALLDPERARHHAKLIVSAAEAGDFEEWPEDERGLWIDAALRRVGREAGGDARAYAAAFEIIPSLLEAPERHEALFADEWTALGTALARAQDGALEIDREGAIAILCHARGIDELPGPVLSRLAPRGCSRWLLAFEQADGAFTYRYERPRWAWADTVVRPRIDAPSRNAIAVDLGAGWALKGELGMTGLLRTTAPIRRTPRDVAEALRRRDTAAA